MRDHAIEKVTQHGEMLFAGGAAGPQKDLEELEAIRTDTAFYGAQELAGGFPVLKPER